MTHDIHGHPIRTTQRDDWWNPASTSGRRKRRSRRDEQDTCMICNCDVFEGYDPLPYCSECRDGYEILGGDDGKRRRGRLGCGDDTSMDREGALENEVRMMEDGRS